VSGDRDKRFAALILLALIFVVVFLVYNHGYIDEPWTKVPYAEEGPFPGFPVDINTADVSALLLLPGVGEKTAEAIIARRQKQGGFSSIEEIRNVRGIGGQKFEALKDFIIVKKRGRSGKGGGALRELEGLKKN